MLRCFLIWRRFSLIRLRLIFFSSRICHSVKRLYFLHLFRHCRSRFHFISFSHYIYKRTNDSIMFGALLKWKQDVSRESFDKNVRSMQRLLQDHQEKNHELIAQVSSLERYNQYCLAKVAKLRTNFVLVDEISHEISQACRIVFPLSNE